MGTTLSKRRATLSVLAAALVMTAGGTAVRTTAAQEKPRSLYARLGGVYSIATVVDDFIERLLVNRNAECESGDQRGQGARAESRTEVSGDGARVRGDGRSVQVHRSRDEGLAPASQHHSG